MAWNGIGMEMKLYSKFYNSIQFCNWVSLCTPANMCVHMATMVQRLNLQVREMAKYGRKIVNCK